MPDFLVISFLLGSQIIFLLSHSIFSAISGSGSSVSGFGSGVGSARSQAPKDDAPNLYVPMRSVTSTTPQFSSSPTIGVPSMTRESEEKRGQQKMGRGENKEEGKRRKKEKNSRWKSKKKKV